MIRLGQKYVCRLPYSDGTAQYDYRDSFVASWVGVGNRIIWVYPETGHPVPLDVLLQCFEEVTK